MQDHNLNITLPADGLVPASQLADTVLTGKYAFFRHRFIGYWWFCDTLFGQMTSYEWPTTCREISRHF